jgi:hypothetical protein
MSEVVHIKAARIPDRDRLLAMLSMRGYDARPLNGVEIDVHSSPGSGPAGSESAESTGFAPRIYGELEDAVMDIGDAFVPIKHEGVIYLRPPVG